MLKAAKTLSHEIQTFVRFSRNIKIKQPSASHLFSYIALQLGQMDCRIKTLKNSYHHEGGISPFYFGCNCLKYKLFILNISFGLFLTFFSGCSKNTNSLKVVFAGDLMLDRGTRSTIKFNSPDFLFDNVNHLLTSADFSIANLECVFCDSSLKPVEKLFVFRANPEWLSTLRDNGISHVTIANNHSMDFGDEGLRQTISNLQKFKIHPIGFITKNNVSCFPTILEKNNIHIAIFSSCFLHSNNGSIYNQLAPDLSIQISAFKKEHPDYFVFVCIHWGIELKATPTSEQVQQAHQILDSGADAIIGHHPHVVQSIEKYHGKYIFYSIGNFIFDNNHSPSNLGIISNFTLSRNGIGSIDIVPFTIVHSKPILMGKAESALFMKEIGVVSINIRLNQYDSLWNLF